MSVGKPEYPDACVGVVYFINAKLEEEGKDVRYKFTMLTPKSYKIFFDKLKNGDIEEIVNFRSELDSIIMEKYRKYSV